MRSLALTADETPADGIRRVALAALDDAVTRLERSDATEKDLHEARKRIKEMRAIARLAADGKPLRMSLRDAARLLASSRDADAMIESFDKLRERFAKEWGTRRFAKIRRALVNRKGAASGDRLSAASSLRFLRSSVAALDFGGANFDRLGDGLIKTYRIARSDLRRAAASRSPERFHEWRKRVKDHWYQTQLIEDASPAILAGHAEALHDLSRLLGDHHDLAVLRESVNGCASARLLRAFDAYIAMRMFELEDDTEKLGRRVLAEKPRAWLRRIRAYWDVWRSGDPRRRKDPKRSDARRSPAAVTSGA